MAGARRLGFLGNPLLLRIDRTRPLRVEHRPAEVARQWRSERRSSRFRREWVITGNAGIVTRQGGETVRRRLVLGVVELRPAAGLVVSLIERPDQRARDCDPGDTREAHQHLAREPCHRRPFGAQAQLPHKVAVTLRLSLFLLAHHASLPSVRTTRTRRSEPLSPRRRSAAANRRSTIMWLPRTR